MNGRIKIPWRWKIKWFIQGMGSIFGLTIPAKQTILEVEQCVDEIIERDKSI